MRTTKKQILLSIVFSAAVFLGIGSKTLAQEPSCGSTLTLSPATGDATTVYTMTASNCVQNIGYRISIFKDGSGVESLLAYSSGAEGSWTIQFGPLAAGTYEIRFFKEGTPFEYTSKTVTVSSTPLPVSAICGQVIPIGASVTCPTEPYCPQMSTGSGPTGGAGRWCACGELNFGCCPNGNSLNRTACQNGLTCESGVCRLDDNNTEKAKYYCGEMVRPEDAGNFECMGCQAAVLDSPGPDGEQYWCTCGGDYQLCCPTAGAQQCEGDCNTKPGITDCSGSGQACVGGVCIIPTQQKVSLCSDQKSVYTAIGCIPIDTLSNFISFALSWGLAISGAVAMLSLAGAAFMIMTSAGDVAKLESGKQMIVAAVSGIFFLVFALFILRLIGVNILGLF